MKSEVDVLLTKYLDGDLTAAEDRDLRDMLSVNPDAKLAFDESVAIHHAIRSDAESLEAPAELVEQTEEAILMRIFGEAPAATATASAPIISDIQRKAFSALLLLLAFMMPSAIGDNPFAQGLENSILLASADAAVSERASVEVQNAALVQSWTQANTNRIARSLATLEQPISQTLASTPRYTETPLSASADNTVPAQTESAVELTPPTDGADQPPYYQTAHWETNSIANASEWSPASASEPLAEDLVYGDGAFDANSQDIIAGDAAGAGPATSPSSRMKDVLAEGSGGIVALTPGISPSIGGEIFLSGTLGSDLLAQNSSDEATALSLSTLGLAYSVSPNGRVGLELGMINFSYPYQTLVWSEPAVGINNDVRSGSSVPRSQRPIKTQQGSTRSPIIKQDSDGGTEEDPMHGPGQESGGSEGGAETGEGGTESGGSGGFLNPNLGQERTAYSVSEIRNKTTVWGGIFYEHEIPIRERISFIGRIGAGGSNEGMLGYLRASGAYEMTNDLSLLIGFDSRAMLLSVFEYKNVNKLDMSFTFTMGLNVRL